VAVASAEPYASYLHFAPEDNHTSTLSHIFMGRMPFLTPSQQRQSTEGTNGADVDYKSADVLQSFSLCYLL